MTRFARAKGSKSSNERLPEAATPWRELQSQLLEKNKEKDNKKAQEKALEQRTANYQAFLKEREEEEAKNVSWAEFPDTNDNRVLINQGKKRNQDSSEMKRPNKNKNIVQKSHIQDNFELNENQEKVDNSIRKKKYKSNKNKSMDVANTPNFELSENQEKVDNSIRKKKSKSNKNKSMDVANTPNFDELKNKLDKILDKSDLNNNSDSDAPPEEASAKDKPKEIIVKKAKIKKPLLKIVQDRQERHDNLSQNQTDQDTNQKNIKKNKKQKNIKQNQDNSEKQINIKDDAKISKEDLPTETLKKIEKKQERYKKQMEKKKQKRKEKKLQQKQENSTPENTSVTNEKKKGPAIQEYNNENLTEKQLLQIQKKKERRARQAEKRKKIREMKQEENGSSIPTKKVKKDKILSKKDDDKNLTEIEKAKIQKKKQKLAKQAEKRKKFKEEKQQHQLENNGIDTSTTNSENTQNEEKNISPQDKKFPQKKGFENRKKPANKLEPKIKNKDHNRKKPFQKPEKMSINGREIDIDYVDGFPIKKEDADRIRQLKKDMINKNLPRSEIDVALKLERRRAEKALSREKKNVCFNCRRSGHNLSDCPELGNNQIVQSAGTGICFKCGSTEHTHFECKVEKGDVYKYASCFICNEQGHIAKQCPDNQRGLYPKGGSCNVCGDVTHLKKDCPKYQALQHHLQNGLNIGTMDNSNPDVMEGSIINNKSSNNRSGKKINRIVKF